VCRCGFLFLSVALTISGCVKPEMRPAKEDSLPVPAPVSRTDLPAPEGGFTLAVGAEVITAEDVITPSLIEHFKPFAERVDFATFARQAKPQVEQLIVGRITNILLYSQAKRELKGNLDESLDKIVETEVRKFIISFGADYARAEQALKQMGMDWQGFRDYQKKMILSRYYLSSRVPETAPITYRQLRREYEKMKDAVFTAPAVLQFRLIDIEIAKVPVTDPNQARSELAYALAEGLLARISAGEDFAELAKDYSHGHRRTFGGLWRPLEPASLAAPYDILALEAEKLQPTQVSGLISADGHIFIMRLEEKRPPTVEPFETVQKQIEAKIRFDRQKKLYDEFNDALAGQAAIANKYEFVSFCLRNIYQKCNE